MKTKNISLTAEGEALPKNSLDDIGTQAQRNRLLAALIVGPVTTYEAREKLNIASPAPRIMELKSMGHKILTSLETLPDGSGRLHPRSARYVLIELAKEVVQ